MKHKIVLELENKALTCETISAAETSTNLHPYWSANFRPSASGTCNKCNLCHHRAMLQWSGQSGHLDKPQNKDTCDTKQIYQCSSVKFRTISQLLQSIVNTFQCTNHTVPIYDIDF